MNGNRLFVWRKEVKNKRLEVRGWTISEKINNLLMVLYIYGKANRRVNQKIKEA